VFRVVSNNEIGARRISRRAWYRSAIFPGNLSVVGSCPVRRTALLSTFHSLGFSRFIAFLGNCVSYLLSKFYALLTDGPLVSRPVSRQNRLGTLVFARENRWFYSRGGRIRTRHVIIPPASVASGLRALTCLSHLRIRKRKNNYFDNYSSFAGCSARGGKTKCLFTEVILGCKDCFLVVSFFGAIF